MNDETLRIDTHVIEEATWTMLAAMYGRHTAEEGDSTIHYLHPGSRCDAFTCYVKPSSNSHSLAHNMLLCKILSDIIHIFSHLEQIISWL